MVRVAPDAKRLSQWTPRGAVCYDPRSAHAREYSSGEVAEWLKAAASKAVVRPCRTVGSNPTLSAIN